MVQGVTIESAMTRLKQHVYKQRVRVKDFVVDFDKLSSGYVHPNHFLTALNMAGVHKHLYPAELEVICEQYKVCVGATSARRPGSEPCTHRRCMHMLIYCIATKMHTWMSTCACIISCMRACINKPAKR